MARLTNPSLGITDANSFKRFATDKLTVAEQMAASGDVQGALRELAQTIALLVGATTEILTELSEHG